MSIDLTDHHPCPRCRQCLTNQALCKWCAEAVRLREERDLLAERQEGLEATACHARVLEEELVKVQTRLEIVVSAASAVVKRWDSNDWRNMEHTGVYIHILRKAIEDTEGEG